MKRIIDGRSYNTDTAAAVAETSWEDEDTLTKRDINTQQKLYQTRGGAFFLVTTESWVDRDGDNCGRNTFEAMSAEKAAGWVMGQNVEILDETVFAAPPEAEAEETPAATIFVRLPASLKTRVEARAKLSSKSMNAWVVEQLEVAA